MELLYVSILIIAVPAAFVASVIVHECGHWLGGILTGYRTVYICFFSFVFYKDASGKNRNARYPGMVGQCIMAPKGGKELKPDSLILDGPIMSIAVGLVAMIAMWVMRIEMIIFSSVLAGMFGMFNLVFGIMNLIPRGTNDGANLKEVKKSDANRKAYNKVMEVYAHNIWGITYMEMSEELLKIPEGAEGSLADELKEYASIRKQSIEYMERTSLELEALEEPGEPDMKMGAWELWEKCRNGDPTQTEVYLDVCKEHIRKKELDLGEWRTSAKLMMKRMELNGFGKRSKKLS